MKSIEKDPIAVLDYGWDWNDWLDGDSISTSTWSISGADSSLTEASSSVAAGIATIWMSGGTDGVIYTVTNKVVTAGGRTDERSFMVNMSNR